MTTRTTSTSKVGLADISVVKVLDFFFGTLKVFLLASASLFSFIYPPLVDLLATIRNLNQSFILTISN